jgi:hypothetical protein
VGAWVAHAAHADTWRLVPALPVAAVAFLALLLAAVARWRATR